MKNSNLPNWLQEQLLDGEQVISKLSRGTSEYYATDKRLLRFQGKSQCVALAYSDLSITFNKYEGAWHTFRRVGGVVLCILLIVVAIVGRGEPIDPTAVDEWYYYTGKISPWLSNIMIILGIICIPIGLHFRYGFYQVESNNIDKSNIKDWQIVRNRWGNQRVDEFANVVSERAGKVVD